MNPPVRDELIAQRSGKVSTKASPISSARIMRRIRCEEKYKTYPNTPSGMTGVQTLVPIMLDHVNAAA